MVRVRARFGILSYCIGLVNPVQVETGLNYTLPSVLTFCSIPKYLPERTLPPGHDSGFRAYLV